MLNNICAEIKPAAASGSWISRWWKKGDAAPGPIKASLGEETTFYFDPELKRWVNKKVCCLAPPRLRDILTYVLAL